ncbi:MAG: nucleotidyltransferase domain-containing protein [Pseudomonadota bacterium]
MGRGLIEDITDAIARRFNPVRIVLFGSHARGEATEESDIDLYVEMETDLRVPERSIAVNEIFGVHSWPMDVVVYTPEEAERLREIHGTLMSIIEAEGVTLYDNR